MSNQELQTKQIFPDRMVGEPRNAEEKRKPRVLLPIVSVFGVIALTGAGVVGGFDQALERFKAADHATTTITGSSELLGFDESYEPQCWTASEVGVHAGVKDEDKALGVVIGSKETTISAKEQNSLCADLTKFDLKVNQKTKQTTIEMPKDALSITSTFVVGSSQHHSDVRGTYAAKDIAHIAAGGVPWVRDVGLAKALATATNGEAQTDDQYNMALALAMKAGADQCAPASWTLGKSAVEAGIENIYKRGLYVAKALYPDVGINPENINVLVGGKPISEIDAVGMQTNLDDTYKFIEGLAGDSKLNFTMNKSNDGTCVPSPDIEKKLANAGSLTATEGKG